MTCSDGVPRWHFSWSQLQNTHKHKRTLRRMRTTGLIQLVITEHLNNCGVCLYWRKAVWGVYREKFFSSFFCFLVVFCPLVVICGRWCGIYCLSTCTVRVCLCVQNRKFRTSWMAMKRPWWTWGKRTRTKTPHRSSWDRSTTPRYMTLYTHLLETCKIKVFLDK